MPRRPGIPFEDKPYIVADNQPKSPYAGNLYVGWTEDRTADSLILFSRSTGGGLVWSAPLRISDEPGRIYGSWMEVVPPPAQGSDGPHAASVIRLGMADFCGTINAANIAQNEKDCAATYDRVT